MYCNYNNVITHVLTLSTKSLISAAEPGIISQRCLSFDVPFLAYVLFPAGHLPKSAFLFVTITTNM